MTITFGKRLLRCIFSPCILTFLSIKIYCCPCLGAYATRLLEKICCFVCYWWCGCKYTDETFPPNEYSLGSCGVNANEVEWRRAQSLSANGSGMKLFAKAIEPNDIEQGSVGNCWLMSAFACLAEFPGAIQKCFATRSFSTRGKYTVKIFDKQTEKWVRVTVDDYVPCMRSTGRPLFAKPNGDEIWVMIYEKAFAKHCGSYGALCGGHAMWALEAMTGDHVFTMKKEGGAWKRLDLVHMPSADNKRAIGVRSTDEVYAGDKLFDILKSYDKNDSVLAASSPAGTDHASDAVRGIVQGHAYALLQVTEVGGFKLMKLRNPWGNFEWTGDWSDGSPLWNTHNEVKEKLKFAGSNDDGCFWMSLQDFVSHFSMVDVCDRSTGVQDLVIDLHEDKGKIVGPCYGWCTGCCSFWCLCRGCARLVCEHESSDKTRESGGCCC